MANDNGTIKANGYFYTENGEFLGQEGSSEKVYLAKKYKQEKIPSSGKIIIKYEECIDLKISHSDFCIISGVVSDEDGFSLDGARTTTQAGFNLVKVLKESSEKKLSLEDQAKWARILFQSGYSSVKNKKILSINDKSIQAKNARAGLIYVMLGKEDLSKGAIAWDGIDFPFLGGRHVKATDQGISITKNQWYKIIKVSATAKDENGVPYFKYQGKIKTEEEARSGIPFLAAKIDPIKNRSIMPGYESGHEIDYIEVNENLGSIYPNAPTAKYVGLDLFESQGTNRWSKGRTIYQATCIRGQQIFWRAYKEHPRNKDYDWSYFADWLKGKSIVLFLFFITLLSSCNNYSVKNVEDINQNIESDIQTLIPYIINTSHDTIYPQDIILKDSSILKYQIYKIQNDTIFKIVLTNNNIDSTLAEYSNSFYFKEYCDFNGYIAFTEKVGSNTYLNLYKKESAKNVIAGAIPYNLDTINNLILFSPSYDQDLSCFKNPEKVHNNEYYDLSVFDIEYDFAKSIGDPFDKCGSFGTSDFLRDLQITKKTKNYIYVSLNECKGRWER